VAVERICHQLSQNGHQCLILIDGDSDSIEKKYDDGLVSVYSLFQRPMYQKTKTIKAAIAWAVYFLPTLLKLRRFIKLHNIDIVVLHFPGIANSYFPALKRLFSVKYVVCVHGSDIHTNIREHPAVKTVVNSVVRNADALIACSEFMLEEARRALQAIPTTSKAIYIGVDSRWAENVPSRSYAINGRYIIANAFPVDVKGTDILLKAFEKISDTFPDVSLVLLGGRSTEKDRQKLINGSSAASKIHILGEVANQDVPSLFSGASFGVVSSRREGFPLVVLEMQLMKKTVIATSVGGLPESIKDGYNGFLIESEDVDSLADRMSFCLEHEEECRIMGENGYRRVISDFNLETTGKQYLQLFDKILLKN